MDFRPSDNLERMRNLLARMERAVDTARDRRHGVVPTPVVTVQPTDQPVGRPSAQANAPQPRTDPAPASLPFPTPVSSGKPKARAKSLEDFDEAFKRLASRQAG